MVNDRQEQAQSASIQQLLYNIVELFSFFIYRANEYIFYKSLETFTGIRALGKFLLPPIFLKKNLDYALNYTPRKGDKFIITYPKCGTTWTQYIVQLILNNGAPDHEKRDLIWDHCIEYQGDEVVRYPLIKTHLPYYYLPTAYDKSVKFLCVLRNPKDSCVSMYNFVLSMAERSPFPPLMGFHQHFMLWFSGHYFMGDYFDITKELWSHRYEPNFTMLIYENMSRNTRGAILKIADYLGDGHRAKLLADDEHVLKKVLKYSQFDNMKANYVDYGKFFRKGQVGDWRNYFNKFESDLVDRKFQELFAGSGLEHVWSDEMRWQS